MTDERKPLSERIDALAEREIDGLIKMTPELLKSIILNVAALEQECRSERASRKVSDDVFANLCDDLGKALGVEPTTKWPHPEPAEILKAIAALEAELEKAKAKSVELLRQKNNALEELAKYGPPAFLKGGDRVHITREEYARLRALERKLEELESRQWLPTEVRDAIYALADHYWDTLRLGDRHGRRIVDNRTELDRHPANH